MVTKLRCITLERGPLLSTTYKGPSGIDYLFQRGCPVEVKNKQDEEYFLAAGNGKFFEKVGIVSNIKNKVKKTKDVAEEPIPEEEPEYKKIPVKIEKYTKNELFALNKDEQVEIIKSLDPEAKIPRLEKNRVNLIMKLQDGGE